MDVITRRFLTCDVCARLWQARDPERCMRCGRGRGVSFVLDVSKENDVMQVVQFMPVDNHFMHATLLMNHHCPWYDAEDPRHPQACWWFLHEQPRTTHITRALDFFEVSFVNMTYRVEDLPDIMG